jgi:hypothetical protein
MRCAVDGQGVLSSVSLDTWNPANPLVKRAKSIRNHPSLQRDLCRPKRVDDAMLQQTQLVCTRKSGGGMRLQRKERAQTLPSPAWKGRRKRENKLDI